MSKPPRESEEAKEILTVRIGARMSDQLEAVAEESDTKSEGYREVLELGLIAYEYGRTPGELELELSKSIWERIPPAVKITVVGAITAVIGLIPAFIGVGIVETLGTYPSPGGAFERILAGGLVATALGMVAFVLGSLYLLWTELKYAIAPGAA
jgi:hypothetical protein